MTSNLRFEDRLDGAKSFRYWKHTILLILEENDLLNHVKEIISEAGKEEAKTKYKRNVVKAKRIPYDSIK